ncbi:hypothetical protein CHLRE_01g020750v5 [Chlamydomonas reinhardtii]|uniref:Uncharacterized protein n=1 Tax=Chlamydomonas reinhardtii TaxID=3055 RepID=A8HPV0_CHLRE|nr:uncharacterized protein CHLRE_01g020750v5 [Chlamydomonas reinhardtii]PNW88238.1 hypothetical protein CHLRE_01g020750v5 [Chlamydomonas reinhardtii]|eukprot:XP_001689509.1 predicted protein [Chlamydomonas reinhardtii]
MLSCSALSRAGLPRASRQPLVRRSDLLLARQNEAWISGQGLGWCSRVRAVETLAAGPAGEAIAELIWELPAGLAKRVFIAFWDIKEQLAAKSDQLAAKSDQLATKTEELYKIKVELTRALHAAGVVNARTFLEYVVKQWEHELFGSVGKVNRLKVIKAGLRKRPELVKCLQRNVPTWVRAGMDEERIVENMAKNLEAIMLDSSNNVHTFHPAIGLTLLKAAHSEPMVAALVCVADNMGVLVKVIKMNAMNDNNDNNISA